MNDTHTHERRRREQKTRSRSCEDNKSVDKKENMVKNVAENIIIMHKNYFIEIE